MSLVILSRHHTFYCARSNTVLIYYQLIFNQSRTPQTFKGNLVIETLSGVKQTIAYGPIASMEAIKHLGTNGGGF